MSYLPDDCSECPVCGTPQFSFSHGPCDMCMDAARVILKLDENFRDAKGVNRVGLCYGLLLPKQRRKKKVTT